MYSLRILTLLLAGLSLWACETPMDKGATKADERDVAGAPESDSEPVAKDDTSSHYSPVGKPDPFRKPTTHKVGPRYDFEGVRLSAIMWAEEEKERYAMIDEPGGTDRIIHEGDLLGSYILVKHIKEDAVIFEWENAVSSEGVREMLMHTMKLHTN